MAIYHLDLVSGNDSNDGSDWANAWLTFGSGPTAARITAGDTIKVAKTADDTDSGVDATFTYGSKTVTLASALTKTIDNATSGWTGSTNITVSTTSSRKIDTTALLIAPASGFTTGKVAYKALGSTEDFSSYTKISFWFRNNASATVPLNQWKICLCSDTTGDTIVNSVYIPQVTTSANGYTPVTVDTGGALGSSIQSIAIYADADPGTTAIILNNIIACNDFSLQNVFGKAGDVNYTIQSIDNTNITIDCSSSTVGGRGYAGTTESARLYYNYGYVITSTGGATIAEGGTTTGGPITFSGGWDTGTNTQTGYTSLIPEREGLNCFSSTRDLIHFENFKLFRFSGMFTSTSGSSRGMQFTNCVTSSFSNGLINNIIDSFLAVDCKFMNCSGTSGSVGSTTAQVKLVNCELLSNTTYALALNSGTVCYYCTFKNNLNNWISSFPYSELGSYPPALRNCTIVDGSYSSSGSSGGVVWSYNENEVANNHKGYSYNAIVELQSSIVHDVEPFAWKATPQTANRTEYFPLIFQLGQVAVTANNLVTVSVWVKKSAAADIVAKVRIPSTNYTLAGTSNESATKANDTDWEELSFTFTPTESGVVPILAEVYYVTDSTSAYFGALTITQA